MTQIQPGQKSKLLNKVIRIILNEKEVKDFIKNNNVSSKVSKTAIAKAFNEGFELGKDEALKINSEPMIKQLNKMSNSVKKELTDYIIKQKEKDQIKIENEVKINIKDFDKPINKIPKQKIYNIIMYDKKESICIYYNNKYKKWIIVFNGDKYLTKDFRKLMFESENSKSFNYERDNLLYSTVIEAFARIVEYFEREK